MSTAADTQDVLDGFDPRSGLTVEECLRFRAKYAEEDRAAALTYLAAKKTGRVVPQHRLDDEERCRVRIEAAEDDREGRWDR